MADAWSGRRLRLWLLLAAAVAVYFVDLGGSSIWDANEAFYTETPREMIERGDYISPTFNYEPRLNKPILSYWIVAGFYHLFGISVGVQRLAIAMGAVVLVGVAFFLARISWPERESAGATLAASWAAIGLAVSPRHVMFGRRIFIDIYISMFMALTLLLFALSERFPPRRRTFLTLMYVAVGLGVITKGPVAAVLPALVFAIYLLAHRELARARSMMIPTGAAIVLAIVLPYYVAQYQRHGWTYIVSFVVGENLERYTEGFGVNATRAPWFYIPVVFSDGFPWSIFLVAAAAWWFRNRQTTAPGDGARVESLLWLWILVIVGFFSVSAAKQDLYVYPIVPALAALGGLTIARAVWTKEAWSIGALRISTVVAAIVMVILGAGVIYLFSGAGAIYALAGTAWIGGIALAGGVMTLILTLRGALRAAVFAFCAALAAVNWVFVVRTLPSFEAYKPAPAFARMLKARASGEDVIATFNVAIPSLVFYLQRHVEMAYDPAPIRIFLEAPQSAFVIMSSDHYADIDSVTDTPTCIIATQPTFNVKLRDILAREPVPDLVLVTNRCGPS